MTETQGSTAELLALLRAARVDLSNEKRAQATLAEAISLAGVAVEREVRLSPSDVVDFMAGDVAIEVKLRGARKKEVYRQLLRYAAHDRVQVLVLVSNLSMGLPETIGGKDVYFVRLGEAWL